MTETTAPLGLACNSPVVDITNYVMLELGQPLHAYDLQLVNGPIQPRMSQKGEKVTLLDEKAGRLDDDTLVISDDSGPIGLAGIMGGLSTAVSDETTDVFFEAAFWPQDFMAGRARSYGLHTDASLRFERGVDPEGQARAVERATALLLEISGGDAGPLVVQTAARTPASTRDDCASPCPSRAIAGSQNRRRNRHRYSCSAWVSSTHVDGRMERQGAESSVRHRYRGRPDRGDCPHIWLRRDTGDHGSRGNRRLRPLPSRKSSLNSAAALVARDYQEVISYSFVDAESNAALCGVESELVLSNPISAEMSVMRSTLWPGMLRAAAANASRQQDRIGCLSLASLSMARSESIPRSFACGSGHRLGASRAVGCQGTID